MQLYDSFFIWSVFVAGIASFFSPCVLPILPVYASVLIDDTGDKAIKIGKVVIYIRPIAKTLAFIAGLSSVFVVLGYGAGALGSVLNSPLMPIVMGVLVILLGLHQAEWLPIHYLYRQKAVRFDKKQQNGYIRSFLLGLGFSFGWSPCIGPVLSAVLAISASGGNDAWYGALLMAVYTLGLAIPFLCVASASSSVMRYLNRVKQYMPLIKKAGGVLIIIMGILLMLGQFNILSSLFH